MNRDEIYMSAITDVNGQVNVGYLVLFRSGRAAIVAIFMLIVGSFIELAITSAHAFNVQALGVAIGAIIAAYGVLLGALGGFLWGDSHSTPQSSSTVTRTDIKVGPAVEEEPAGGEPVGTPIAIPGVEPLSPTIQPKDVGSNVAIVKPTKKGKTK